MKDLQGIEIGNDRNIPFVAAGYLGSYYGMLEELVAEVWAVA